MSFEDVYLFRTDGECTTDQVYLFSSNMAVLPGLLRLGASRLSLHKEVYVDL